MTLPDGRGDGRRQILAELKSLFAQLDKAYARGDFEMAHATNLKVGDLLRSLDRLENDVTLENEPQERHVPTRRSGIQMRKSAPDDESNSDADSSKRVAS